MTSEDSKYGKSNGLHDNFLQFFWILKTPGRPDPHNNQYIILKFYFPLHWKKKVAVTPQVWSCFKANTQQIIAKVKTLQKMKVWKSYGSLNAQ